MNEEVQITPNTEKEKSRGLRKYNQRLPNLVTFNPDEVVTDIIDCVCVSLTDKRILHMNNTLNICKNFS